MRSVVVVTIAWLALLQFSALRLLAATPDWSAPPWIAPPGVAVGEYGVYLFRHEINLDKVPESLVVRVSADQRYRLLVNGKEVAIGPCRGHLQRWAYETVDLAPHLHPGRNVLSATVWHLGAHTPAAQISHRVAFLLQAADESNSIVDTSPRWHVLDCDAYAPLPLDRQAVPFYYVAGPGDVVDGAKYPWAWNDLDFDDSAWPHAIALDADASSWQLEPRPLPAMEKRVDRFAAVRRSQGVDVDEAFVAGDGPLTIPAHAKATILLDHGVLTNAYPELTVDGGRGATVELTYAEALWRTEDGRPTSKGDRDAIEGKTILGNQDRFLPDGGRGRVFRPLWFRTFRYVQLDVRTSDEPLVIRDATAEFTGYPLEQRAWFHSSDPELDRLWEIGWRTIRLCANETLYDCPYYEQLQYVGDTRTQSCFIRYLSGDDRLPRRAIQDFYDSISVGPSSAGIDGYDPVRAKGLTLSRFPCHEPQSIPPYSLYWISMLHDDWQWRGDAEFVRGYLDGIRSVLAWHEKQLDKSGMLAATPGWRFVDWSFPKLPAEGLGGVPPYDSLGRSAVLSLQLAYTYDQAAELMQLCGEARDAAKYRALAQRLKSATMELCWNADRRLIADTPGGSGFSQHANIFGLLSDAIPKAEQPAVLERLMADDVSPQATVYFRYYLNRALEYVGRSDAYLDTLGPWHAMLQLGLTTFAETPEPSRSDCHAWGSSPGYEMLRLVAGVRPAEPGFRVVEVAPSLGRLTEIDAGLPTPAGTVEVQLHRAGSTGVAGAVTLPAGTTGVFRWAGQKIELAAGTNNIQLDQSP